MPRTVIILFALVMALGAWLRFAHLGARGLLFFDEGVYVLGARFLRGWWLTLVHHGWAAAHAYRLDSTRWLGLPSPFAKPAHDGWLMLGMLIGGPSLLSALRMTALFGTLTLAAVYWIGRRAFDPWVGLVATALAAVSVYQLGYARSALAETEAMWWWLVAIGVLLPGGEADSHEVGSPQSVRHFAKARSVRHFLGRPSGSGLLRLLISGACGGLAFLSNYRLWMIPPCLAIVDACRRRDLGAPRAILRRSFLLTAGFLAPLLIAMLVDGACSRGASSILAPTYWSQLFSRYSRHVPEGFTLSGWWAYPYMLWSLDGGVMALACGAGLMGLAWRGDWTGRGIAAVTLCIVGFFSLFHTHHARYISVALPLLSLAAAWAMVQAARWWLRRWRLERLEFMTLICVLIGVVLWQLPDAVALTRQRTAYTQVLPALQALAPVDEAPVIATQPYILQALGGRRYLPPPQRGNLHAWAAHGSRYLVVDYQVVFGAFGELWDVRAQELAAALHPVVVLANPAGASQQVAFEHVTDPGLTRRQLADPGLRAFMGSIAICDLAHGPVAAPTEKR